MAVYFNLLSTIIFVLRYALTNFLGVTYVILIVTLGFVLDMEAAFSVEELGYSDPLYVLVSTNHGAIQMHISTSKSVYLTTIEINKLT